MTSKAMGISPFIFRKLQVVGSSSASRYTKKPAISSEITGFFIFNPSVQSPEQAARGHCRCNATTLCHSR